ncbi:hypothetical protein EZJ43_12890 [Pedobacter changchengzhani]|uniref:Uncharacterized protein n=1 Tax=Pedobacter changchengzhani TaxID=2529274 RepID=A0A4R5MIU2_9SPHI|nr:hypothetical protein [Pedobacter changchengzhani]TDG35514.1 hypothetical protein EZJ43_12890 [Pedobacter changchengzhani]
MAKSGKIVQLHQKPENYIKSRARELQIGKCYINADWEEAGIANVIVSREHTNGNFTLGVYLIDFKCLGIKDAYFKFNLSADDFDKLVDLIGGVEIDYIKAHNMVYGAEAFANDCGFKPHKDWAIAQFVLEEDDEKIPIIEIEFGEDGKPAYYVGPNDTPAKIKQILATLDKTMGRENYLFYYDEDDDVFDDELIFPDDDFDKILDGKKLPNLMQLYFILLEGYDRQVKPKVAINLDEDLVGEILEEMVVGNFYTINNDLEAEISKCVDLHEAIFDEKCADSIVEINKLLIKNPNNPYFYIELFLQYKHAQFNSKAKEIAKQGMLLFPDFLYFRFLVAHAEMVDGDIEKGFKLLNSNYYLNQAFPQRTTFSEGELMFFYASICEYFLEKGDIDSAIACGNILIDDVNQYACNELAIIGICKAMKDKIEKFK